MGKPKKTEKIEVPQPKARLRRAPGTKSMKDKRTKRARTRQAQKKKDCEDT